MRDAAVQEARTRWPDLAFRVATPGTLVRMRTSLSNFRAPRMRCRSSRGRTIDTIGVVQMIAVRRDGVHAALQQATSGLHAQIADNQRRRSELENALLLAQTQRRLNALEAFYEVSSAATTPGRRSRS